MATKRLFAIPTLSEMEHDSAKQTQVKSAFKSHHLNASKSESTNGFPSPKKIQGEQQINRDIGQVGSNKHEPNSFDGHQARVIYNAPQQQVAPPTKSTPVASANNQPSTVVNIGPVSPAKKMKTNAIIVNSRQKGNPIIKFIRNVPWEFGEIIPDYQLGQTTCALFLSLRYHHLNPDYIHVRLKQLGQNYALRVLLLQVDVKDPYHSLKELAKICILADCTLILAWSAEEAGRYLETYKAFESKPADLIKEQTDNNFLSKLTDSLTSVKSVNRTDAMTLLNTFGCFNNIVEATSEDLSLCPGFGPQKAQRLHDIFHEPFLKQKRVINKSTETKDKQSKKS